MDSQLKRILEERRTNTAICQYIQSFIYIKKYKMIHESKYNMMCDLIKYYENIHTEIL